MVHRGPGPKRHSSDDPPLQHRRLRPRHHGHRASCRRRGQQAADVVRAPAGAARDGDSGQLPLDPLRLRRFRHPDWLLHLLPGPAQRSVPGFYRPIHSTGSAGFFVSHQVLTRGQLVHRTGSHEDDCPEVSWFWGFTVPSIYTILSDRNPFTVVMSLENDR